MLASWKGCEVFENIGCTGKTDLVLKHPELGMLEVDVKCRTWSQGHWKPASTWRVGLPVWPVTVTPHGDIADWKISWVQGREPDGWEDFWTNDNRFYTTSSTKPSV